MISGSKEKLEVHSLETYVNTIQEVLEIHPGEVRFTNPITGDKEAPYLWYCPLELSIPEKLYNSKLYKALK